jgi:uncharacterized protein YidB (DUF937 family)
MGLLDTIAGEVLNRTQGGAPPGGLMEAISGILGQGGLQDLVQKFQQGGMGDIIASWISTGHNLPISPEQLQAVLGSGQVQAIAAKLGLSPAEVSSHLSELLPKVVDHLTPDGNVPHAGALDGLLGMLKATAR